MTAWKIIQDVLFLLVVIAITVLVLGSIGMALPAEPPQPWRGKPSPFGAADQLGL